MLGIENSAEKGITRANCTWLDLWVCATVTPWNLVEFNSGREDSSIQGLQGRRDQDPLNGGGACRAGYNGRIIKSKGEGSRFCLPPL